MYLKRTDIMNLYQYLISRPFKLEMIPRLTAEASILYISQLHSAFAVMCPDSRTRCMCRDSEERRRNWWINWYRFS